MSRAVVEQNRSTLTPCTKFFLEKLTVTQLVKKYPASYDTWSFITLYTRIGIWKKTWRHVLLN